MYAPSLFRLLLRQATLLLVSTRVHAQISFFQYCFQNAVINQYSGAPAGTSGRGMFTFDDCSFDDLANGNCPFGVGQVNVSTAYEALTYEPDDFVLNQGYLATFVVGMLLAMHLVMKDQARSQGLFSGCSCCASKRDRESASGWSSRISSNFSLN